MSRTPRAAPMPIPALAPDGKADVGGCAEEDDDEVA